MSGTHTFCALLFCLPLAAQVFPTGDPVMPRSDGEMHPMTPAEYQKFAASVKGVAYIKVIDKLPPNLSPNYRLGYNFVYESANHGWILDRDADGYKLFLDIKGDGDLSHVEALRFRNEGSTRRIDVPMNDSAAHWTTRFELVEGPGGDADVALSINSATYRSGKILLDGREIPFRVLIARGRYGARGTGVSFDSDGKGKYESYNPDDRWVNLAGKTYEFHVDPHGDSLTLKESDPRPDRPSLRPGSPIPDVSVTDLGGRPHALRRNAAEFTLVEFWNTNCAPCLEEIPKLKILYDKVPHARFDILGISSDESDDVLKKYLAQYAIPWPECRESAEGAVYRTMRIEGVPAYFLLSKSGEIVDHWTGAGPTISKIEAALK